MLQCVSLRMNDEASFQRNGASTVLIFIITGGAEAQVYHEESKEPDWFMNVNHQGYRRWEGRDCTFKKMASHSGIERKSNSRRKSKLLP